MDQTRLVTNSALQADGKVILAGDFTMVGATSRNRVARFDEDGYNDTSFSIGTGANDDVYAVEIQDDNKILVGGDFSTFGGISRGGIERLNENGSRDTAFSPGSGANMAIKDFAIQDDGKIIVGGSFTSFDGTSANSIVRLTSSGAVDATFNTGTGFNDGVEAVGI